jgi:hypothetical protein
MAAGRMGRWSMAFFVRFLGGCAAGRDERQRRRDEQCLFHIVLILWPVCSSRYPL